MVSELIIHVDEFYNFEPDVTTTQLLKWAGQGARFFMTVHNDGTYTYKVRFKANDGSSDNSIYESNGYQTFTASYSQSKQEQPTMSLTLYEVYIINLSTHDTLSELVVTDSEAKAHIKAFAQAGLGGTSVDGYHFICKRVGDVPSDE